MNVIISDNIFLELNKYVDFSKKVCVLTDDNVYQYYFKYFEKYNNIYPFIIPHGEESKSIDNYLNIINFLLNNYFSRTDYLLSVGGGVVTDLGGFVSSTYKRGINHIILPTTFLSMVDAAIGGKTGINFQNVKNVLGTFYLPQFVLISLNTLSSLDNRNLNSGIMESLKMGLIGDATLFNLIKDNDSLSIKMHYQDIISRSIDLKEKIVSYDFKDEGIRKYLNLGHTIGHALEEMDLGLIHGECVALGMIPFVNKEYELSKIIHKYIDFSFLKNVTINEDLILEKIKNDKKLIDGKINFVYCEKISDMKFIFLSDEELRTKIREIIYEISIW